MTQNIRIASYSDIHNLTELFWNNLSVNPEYISHGEIQMGVGDNEGKPALNGKEMWKKYISGKISDENSEVLIYSGNNNIDGFTVVAIEEDGAEPFGVVCDLYVKPGIRRKGIGNVLFESGLNWLRNKGMKDFYLESGKDNHSAHIFFEKRGFKMLSHIYHKSFEK